MESSEKPKHVQVSIAQYMFKNIHLLGFENTQRVLNVAIRELMDNALDAANQNRMNPKVEISITALKNKLYRIGFKDNGPGIAPQIVPNVCCKLLYGNKFVDNKPQRGQQGLGLTALILYSQKTSGLPARIVSKTKSTLEHEFLLSINLKTNTPIIVKKRVLEGSESVIKAESGFYVELVLEAQFIKKGPRATPSFLQQYSFLNPNLELEFEGPQNTSFKRERVTSEIPNVGQGVRLVPHHLSIGELKFILKEGAEEDILTTLEAKLEGSLDLKKKCLDLQYIPYFLKSSLLNDAKLEGLIASFKQVFKDSLPSQECLTDLGPMIRKAVTKNETLVFDKIISVKSNIVYYQKGALKVEACAFYGNPEINKDEKIVLYRVANGTPLINQASSCCITKTVIDFEWKKTGLTHVENELPKGNLILFIHVNSTKTPYITESKDAIADVPEIRTCIRQCLLKLGKQIRTYMKKEEFYKVLLQKKVIIQKVLPDLISTLEKGLAKPIKEDLDLEFIKALIFDLVCFFEKEDHIRCINGTKKMKRFKYKLDKEFLEVVIEPYQEKLLHTKVLQLDEISPVEYFYIRQKKPK